MKKILIIGVLFFFFAIILFSCGSSSNYSSPANYSVEAKDIPPGLSIIIDAGGLGFTVKNTDSRQYRVVVDVITSGANFTDSFTVPANDIYHKTWVNNNMRAVKVIITDWI